MITVFRVLGETDRDTGGEPVVYLCQKCEQNLYDDGELEEIAEMTGGCCDECGL